MYIMYYVYLTILQFTMWSISEVINYANVLVVAFYCVANIGDIREHREAKGEGR